MLPERDVAAIESYCERRNDPETSDQLRVEAQVEPTTVMIVERRAPWRADFGPEWSTVNVARLRYTATKREWTLQSADSNGRWSRYEYINSVARVEVLLNEIDRDPTGIFWGASSAWPTGRQRPSDRLRLAGTPRRERGPWRRSARW